MTCERSRKNFRERSAHQAPFQRAAVIFRPPFLRRGKFPSRSAGPAGLSAVRASGAAEWFQIFLDNPEKIR